MPIPRALYCDFPLGRPLGRPDDPAFQRRVLDAAFALLDASEPTLATYPETILDEVDQPLACPMPARLDPSLAPALAEARGLRPAFERAQAGGLRTDVDVEVVEEALFAFGRVAAGTPWEEAGIPRNPIDAALNVRAYYEQAATALAGHVPAARAGESWFARETAAGALVHDAQQAMKDAGAPFPFWFYLLPASQHRLH